VLAVASDLADGKIARRFSTPSLAGYLQDSIADKIFNFGCLFALAIRFQWVEFLAWGLLIREFLILAERITDREIAVSLKRFKRHVVWYSVLVRAGIFGFFVASLTAGRMATALQVLSYGMLAAAVVWGAINVIQMIFLKEPNERALERSAP
jgi:phosphatidylglycerophosphate synthase